MNCYSVIHLILLCTAQESFFIPSAPFFDQAAQILAVKLSTSKAIALIKSRASPAEWT